MSRMNLAGMTPTGRRIPGPGSDLVELESEKGLKHTAIVFHAEWRGVPSLAAGLHPVLPFLEKPGVTGVLPLVRNEPDEGAFVYPSGTVFSIAEIVRVYADLGAPPGMKAGLELCYLAGELLSEAAAAGSQVGLQAHGGLSPWRIACKADGQVVILGYGIPSPEIVTWVEDERGAPKEDSFRYCPPERLDGAAEDLGSDLFSLALVASELMVGRPVYDGVLAEIRQQATRGEAVRRLYQWGDKLPDPLREVLVRALKPDVDARYRDGAEFVYAFHDLLSSVDAEGPSLAEVVRKVRAIQGRGKYVPGETGQLTAEELAEIAAELANESDAKLPPPRLQRPSGEPPPEPGAEPPRWVKVAREPGKTAEPAPTAEPRPRPASPPLPSMPPPEESARDRLRRRLKEKSGQTEPMAARAPSPPAAPPPAAPPPPPAAPPPPPPGATLPKPVPPGAFPAVVAEPAPRTSASELLERLRASAPPRPKLADPLAAGAASGGSGPSERRLDLLVDGAVRSASIPVGATLAEAAARIATEAGLPTDLLGNLSGWWRLEQDGRRWAGTEPVGVLDAERPVNLTFVPNRIQTVTVEVRGLAEPMRFRAPVGTAVPVRSLLEHLRRWLSLPSAAWTLQIDGRTLAPLQILEEVEPGDATTLVVSR